MGVWASTMAPPLRQDVASAVDRDISGGARDTCCVSVFAADASNHGSFTSFRIAAAQPLREVQASWAEHFDIPAHVVGFEDGSQVEVELSKSPKELGWARTVQVYA